MPNFTRAVQILYLKLANTFYPVYDLIVVLINNFIELMTSQYLSFDLQYLQLTEQIKKEKIYVMKKITHLYRRAHMRTYEKWQP